jgi:hypothetical protein
MSKADGTEYARLRADPTRRLEVLVIQHELNTCLGPRIKGSRPGSINER